MKPTQMIFFATMLLLLVGVHLYVFRRLWLLVPPEAATIRAAVIVCGIVLTVAVFASVSARFPIFPVWLTTVVWRVATAWIMVFFYLLVVFAVGDLLRLVHLLPKSVMFGNWLTFGILIAAFTAVFVAANINYNCKRRAEITMEADIVRPVKIVAVSDLHLGYGIGRRELARWVETINREKPDVVLIAGDAIDTSTRPLWQGDYAAELRRIDAPSGVFAVQGNHEYISDIDESLRFLEHAGVRVLRDSSVVLAGNLAIVGRDDRSNGARKSIAELTKGLFDDRTKIVVDHQPFNLGEAAEAGVDLQISGHTHRGQIWPATWITDRMFECSHGAYSKGSTRYYILQGLGIWGGKFRIGSRSEYLVIEINPHEVSK